MTTMKFLSLTFLALVSVLAGQGAQLRVRAAPEPSPDEQDIFEVFRSLRMHHLGFIHVGNDGVARSVDGNGTVIDFSPMSNAQLQKTAKIFVQNATQHDHLRELWKGVSGHDVENPHIWSRGGPPLEPPQDSKHLKRQSPNIQCHDLKCSSNIFCHTVGCRQCIIPNMSTWGRCIN
ncbi:uncharacterized protein PADG_11213 [Paracoccidioides brasiliensis Pb18]|uniref:Uncharacterized protein n=1 Tax=Paracoccidioides brasiliensis (strain Pb18) TaxID=502780 RepID=A0A0A0HZK2_PARBD|nr:uncharacterized protein PADG_11213 [Paracoccidioides brasiliensis Pb18]KGM92755.1 hypothetical protein PADG_11213 [Paracoccidioides brasiliensis Pb18]ODH49156.1 hypothetical protein GX48_04774 [Paracoccidioides brasiliensis]